MPLPWETGSRLANHANSVRVQHSLKQVALEQRTANVKTSKAALIDASVYDLIQSSLLEQWTLHLRAGDHFSALCEIRLAFLCALLWHTGLRLEDALRLLAQQISFSPYTPTRNLIVQINVTKSERDNQPYRVIAIDDDNAPYSICSL